MSTGRKHLTYVIDERHKRLSPTLYAIAKQTSLPDAIAALAAREGCPATRIGYVRATAGTRHRSRTGHWLGIQKWLQARSLDAAIWTDLPPRPGRFSVDAAIRTWKKWPVALRESARQYVNLAPKGVDTDLRRRLRAEGLA